MRRSGVMQKTEASRKKGTNVYLSTNLIEEAKELEINLSATLEQALADAVQQRRRQKWLENNKAGIVALNEFIEETGLFSDDERFKVI